MGDLNVSEKKDNDLPVEIVQFSMWKEAIDLIIDKS